MLRKVGQVAARRAAACQKSSVPTSVRLRQKLLQKHQMANFMNFSSVRATLSSSQASHARKLWAAEPASRMFSTEAQEGPNGLTVSPITSDAERKYYKTILQEGKSHQAGEAETFQSVLTFLAKPADGKLLPRDAIVGWMRQSPPVNKRSGDVVLEPTNFVENPFFHQTIQKFIAEHIADSTEMQLAAAEAVSGWLNIYDGRAAFPGVRRTAEDIFGSIKLENGRMVKGSYEPMPTHRLLTVDGIFRLDAHVESKFIEYLNKL